MDFEWKHRSIVNMGQVIVESKNEHKCTNLTCWTNSSLEVKRTGGSLKILCVSMFTLLSDLLRPQV